MVNHEAARAHDRPIAGLPVLSIRNRSIPTADALFDDLLFLPLLPLFLVVFLVLLAPDSYTEQSRLGTWQRKRQQ